MPIRLWDDSYFIAGSFELLDKGIDNRTVIT